jgi:hypothetical protein
MRWCECALARPPLGDVEEEYKPGLSAPPAGEKTLKRA